MTKKHFIALADHIKERNNKLIPGGFGITAIAPFDEDAIEALADFCQAQNPQFNRERWFGYIRGTCGKNGGAVK